MLRKTILAVLLCLCLPAMADDSGLLRVKSAHDVSTTADRLVNALNAKGMTVFDRIDHAAGAQKAGLELAPTTLVIFGNPKVGTPLMQCAITAAIDLPQKMLIWQDDNGDVWILGHKVSGEQIG